MQALIGANFFVNILLASFCMLTFSLKGKPDNQQ